MMSDLNISRTQFKDWGSAARVTLKGADERDFVTYLEANRGDTISLVLRMSVWNNNKDSCIHQRVLALDHHIVKEVYSGVPSGVHNLTKDVLIETAALTPGLHMLWHRCDLQYNMRDAVAHFKRSHDSSVVPSDTTYCTLEAYNNFVAWVRIA